MRSWFRKRDNDVKELTGIGFRLEYVVSIETLRILGRISFLQHFSIETKVRNREMCAPFAFNVYKRAVSSLARRRVTSRRELAWRHLCFVITTFGHDS